MRKIAIVAALLAGTAQAEIVTFEADGDVVFTRCTDFAVETACELIFPTGTASVEYVCVAIDDAGKPIGAVAAPEPMFPSGAWFQGIPVNDIADVKCRKR